VVQPLPGNLLLPPGWGSAKCIEADVEPEFIAGGLAGEYCAAYLQPPTHNLSWHFGLVSWLPALIACLLVAKRQHHSQQ
jgi:hypothetical protein